MRLNLNSRKGAEFIPNFKNSPRILKGKTLAGTELKIYSNSMRSKYLMSRKGTKFKTNLETPRAF